MRSRAIEIQEPVGGRSAEGPGPLPPIETMRSRLVDSGDDHVDDCYWVTPAPEPTTFLGEVLGLHGDSRSQLLRQGVLAAVGFALAVVAVIVATPEEGRVETAAPTGPEPLAAPGRVAGPAFEEARSRLRTQPTTTLSTTPTGETTFSIDAVLIGRIITDSSIAATTTSTAPPTSTTSTTEATSTTIEPTTVPPSSTTVATTATTGATTSSSSSTTVASTTTTGPTTSSSSSTTVAPTTTAPTTAST